MSQLYQQGRPRKQGEPDERPDLEVASGLMPWRQGQAADEGAKAPPEQYCCFPNHGKRNSVWIVVCSLQVEKKGRPAEWTGTEGLELQPQRQEVKRENSQHQEEQRGLGCELACTLEAEFAVVLNFELRHDLGPEVESELEFEQGPE